MTEDITGIVKDDDHGTHWQEITEQVPEEKETCDRVMQEHFLKIVTSLSHKVVQQIRDPHSKLEQAIEENNLVDFLEGHIDEGIGEVALSQKIPWHPVLVFANHVAPNR